MINLQDISVRKRLLLPPLIICIIGAIIAFHAYTNFAFNIIKPIQYTFVSAAIWLLIMVAIILRSDFKHNREDI